MNRRAFSNWKLWIVIALAVMLTGILPEALRAQSIESSNRSGVPATVSYPIVDTNQTKCYNASIEIACPTVGTAFYGQDAQATTYAPSYTNNGDGTVTDNVTGLMWQRSPDLDNNGTISATDKLTYTAAITYCDNLTLAGYADWRLPNIKTLYSLIEFSGADPSGWPGSDTSSLTPFIDNTAFAFAYGDTSAGERIIDAQYASSTLYASTTGVNNSPTMFGVNFADGRIKGYGLITPNGGNKTFFVKCVRGNTSYGVNVFVDNGDQTITDNATNLMWTKSDSGTAMNWQDALAWVQTKNAQTYLGHNDWRLPNAKEMQSIFDYTRSPSTTNSATIDPIFNATSFINEGGQTDWPWYWTSTTHATYTGSGGPAVYIAFGRASGWQKATPSATCYTFYDVHGAGAQRSDPKTISGLSVIGTACSGGTAYGQGPQGDVERGLHYLRLVRAATTATSSYALTVTTAGTGSGIVSPSGVTTYTAGTVVTLTAVADSTSLFIGWSGALNSSTNPVTLTMNSDRTITATFQIRRTVYLPLMLSQ